MQYLKLKESTASFYSLHLRVEKLENKVRDVIVKVLHTPMETTSNGDSAEELKDNVEVGGDVIDVLIDCLGYYDVV